MNAVATKKIIIITAPSGAGKTSITHYLLNNNHTLSFSVSATTRHARGKEIAGVDYYFVTREEFTQKIKEDAFIEWEMVYEGKYYGTLKTEIERIWNDGKTPLLDIDVKGAIKVQQQFPGKCLSVFIEPPSITELKKRLEKRGTETPETIAIRLSKAALEISFKHHFNITIVNEDLQKACIEAEKAVQHFLESGT